MTTPQLPPLPEPAGALFAGTGPCAPMSGYDADQMRAYALAALSTRPVAESIHEANARTLQALVDELREMLGVKEGESLKEAVQQLAARPVLPEPLGWYVVNNMGMATLCADEGDARLLAEDGDKLYPRQAPHRAVQLAVVAPIKKEQEA